MEKETNVGYVANNSPYYTTIEQTVSENSFNEYKDNIDKKLDKINNKIEYTKTTNREQSKQIKELSESSSTHTEDIKTLFEYVGYDYRLMARRFKYLKKKNWQNKRRR